ncbi:MAG: LAGLIDADG homing endonuclease [Candidatus Moranbacteria bacterium GW2011_GWA2_39_41]|nr:MAG: LAGLIDADG homing endonuclease [Candidatus Moranbacteria bacterium GW2011_GWA2_39_41]
MCKNFSSTISAYLAGFLDGDGSIYVRLKPNSTYRYGFQVAPYIVLFQSNQDRENFEKICSIVGLGILRERKDGILEYSINRADNLRLFLASVKPFLILKKKQAELMLKILAKKEKVQNHKDFEELAQLVDSFRDLNYSKKRKIRVLTP